MSSPLSLGAPCFAKILLISKLIVSIPQICVAPRLKRLGAPCYVGFITHFQPKGEKQ